MGQDPYWKSVAVKSLVLKKYFILAHFAIYISGCDDLRYNEMILSISFVLYFDIPKRYQIILKKMTKIKEAKVLRH